MKPWALAGLLALAQGAAAQEVASGGGAVLRGLDKVDGDVVDMTLAVGEAADIGRLSVELLDCRYPRGKAASDAFAYVTIRESRNQNILFTGWMIASSPALNALEHPRYDVWVLRCNTE